jgi:putative SOS response-associated peptidase YedK
MCARYQLWSDMKKIAIAFNLGNMDLPAPELAPNYNATPGTMQPVIIWEDQFGVRTMDMMFWRFLPPNVIDPKKFSLDTINAHGETLLPSNVWRDSFISRRCLVPVNCFTEWQRKGSKKLPWMFGMKDDSLFCSRWRLASLVVSRSQVIHGLVRHHHHRAERIAGGEDRARSNASDHQEIGLSAMAGTWTERTTAD